MGIRLHNTMTRRKEELVTRDPGRVAMYVCGPTVYNYIHIGNARTFLSFDIIRRYLLYSGYEVEFVQNVTDVDDKIINKAAEEGVGADEVATRYREAFEQDMEALGVMPPTIAPRATEHIPDMIDVIERLIDRGFAYLSEGDVYFEVAKFEGYGKLSGRTLEDQQVTTQFESEMERKHEVYDFALWKAAKPGEPSWPSPWGPGRPGWHIECSTMSAKYLGETFDVHGGGQDLVFPHHENETAQSEAATDKPFVRYWLHSGMLNIDSEKMSKSLGNITSLREVLAEHDADTVRMLALSTHYRSPLNFSEESLAEAAASLERIRNCRFNIADALGHAGDPGATGLGQAVERARAEFRTAMDDDFNSAAALGSIFALVRDVNTALDTGSFGRGELLRASETLDELCSVLGLFEVSGGAGGGTEPGLEALLSELLDDPAVAEGLAVEQVVERILDERVRARSEKRFDDADMIRDRLGGLGVRVEDVRDGYRWRFER